MGDVPTKQDQQRRSSKRDATRELETEIGALNVAACVHIKVGTHSSSSGPDLENWNIVDQTVQTV
jgi:hypothetical protein